MMKSMILAVSGWVGLWAAVSAASACAEETRNGLRSFALEAGQVLHYRVRAGFWWDGADGKPEIPREPDGTPKYETRELHVVVTGKGRNGGFHVVLKSLSSLGHPFLTEADLFPDGRLVRRPETMPTLEEDGFRSIFPLLPDGSEKEWREVEARTGLEISYRLEGAEILAEFRGPLDRVADGAAKARYQFDPKTGLPQRIESGGYWKSYGEMHEGLITLDKVELRDPNWGAKYGRAASAYFAALAESRRLVGHGNAAQLAAAAREPERLERAFAESRAALEAARPAVADSPIEAELDRALKEFDKYRAGREEGLRGVSAIAERPSPAWKSRDLNGKEHDLAEYRGQVVVLDFWFRKCSYCIRAMPQVEQAAEHFRRKKAPVAFLGVCTDDDPADARHVAKTLKLSSPVLPEKGLAEKYGVDRFPRLLVLDQQGAVRGIFSGYSLTLREDLIACIEKLLLAENGPRAPPAP